MPLNGKIDMGVQLDCFPCFLRQTVIALRLANANGQKQAAVLKAVLKDIEAAGAAKTPAHATTVMHRTIRQTLGLDPYAEIKSRYNHIALGLYEKLEHAVAESEDPLWRAARLAIAGNVIDFGIFTSVNIEGTVERALGKPIEQDDYGEFKEAVEEAGEILYLLDNAGEIVFDRLLIETLSARGKKVTAVVKGGPIINDCTMEDARQAGLIGSSCRVIDNGSDAVGTILESASAEFNEAFRRAPLIISKGQGNFETLVNEARSDRKGPPPYFLFQSKCEVVSRALGLPQGAMLLMKGG